MCAGSLFVQSALQRIVVVHICAVGVAVKAMGRVSFVCRYRKLELMVLCKQEHLSDLRHPYIMHGSVEFVSARLNSPTQRHL